MDFVQRCCPFCLNSFCVIWEWKPFFFFLVRVLSSGNGSSKDKVRNRNICFISVTSSLLWSSQLNRKKLVFKRHSSVSFFSPSAAFRSRGLVSHACGQPGSCLCLCLRADGNWSSATKSRAWKEKVGTLIVSVLLKTVCCSEVCVPVYVFAVMQYPEGRTFLFVLVDCITFPKTAMQRYVQAGDRFTRGSLRCKNHLLSLADQFKCDLLHRVCVTALKVRVYLLKDHQVGQDFSLHFCFSFWKLSEYQNRINDFCYLDVAAKTSVPERWADTSWQTVTSHTCCHSPCSSFLVFLLGNHQVVHVSSTVTVDKLAICECYI